MKNQIAVFSSKRSTHHAFLEKILKGKDYVYKNNCILKKEGSVFPQETIVEGNGGLLVASFEQSFSLSDVYDEKIYHSLGMNIEETERIIYLRDPLNTAASTYSVYKTVDRIDIAFVEKNLQHYCSIFDKLDHSVDIVFVYSNMFWIDFEYRKCILEKLSFQDSCVAFDSRQSYFGGGGNSFFKNKDNLDTKALSSRFLDFKNDYKFSELVEQYDLKFKAKEMAEKFNDKLMLDNIKKYE